MAEAVEIPISDRSLRMIRSYHTLSGKPVTEIMAEMSDIVSTSLEERLSNKIAGELGLPQATSTKVVAASVRYEDTTGISDGLGDVDPGEPEEVEGSTNEEEFVPESGGASDADLEKDMTVEDPVHEAKAEALTKQTPDEIAEEIFANVAGYEAYVDPRIAKRKKVNRGKGKVRPMNYKESENSP